VVVVSSAVNRTNPEVAAALANRIPVVPRAEMLGELMRFRYSSRWPARMARPPPRAWWRACWPRADSIRPSSSAAAEERRQQCAPRRGPLPGRRSRRERCLVHAPAAHDRHRHQHRQRSSGTHDGDFSRLKQSFVDFLHNLPFYGLAVLCADDANVQSILESVGGRS
jgi:UDP-N-acetylmuramate--alanine ligase